MTMIKRGKQGQFYLIAAVIIILIIVGLAGVKNYVSVKKEPPKFQDFSDMLGREGKYAIEYGIYSNSNTKTISESLINLTSDYMTQNYEEDFVLYIVYGDITGNNISSKKISKVSQGDISLNTAGTEFNSPGSSTISPEDITLTINSDPPNTVTVNITVGTSVISQTLPVLKNNNFVFAMTTSNGLSQYITTNTQETR